jgi:hypothetical protein
MSKRAEAIADRIDQGTEALASFAESLSEAEWQTVVPNEGRTVAALVRHTADSFPFFIEWAGTLAEGKPITGVTWDIIDQMNAQHGQEHAAANKRETIDLLRTNSKTAADKVREFTDEELDNVATVCLYWDTPLSAQWLIEYHHIRHSYHHLDSIRAALNDSA